MASYQRSACERVFVNASVVEARSSASITCGRSRSPRCPAQGNRSIGSGISVENSRLRGTFASMRCACLLRCGPTSAVTASSRFESVADNPHVIILGRMALSLDSASSVCTPRFVPRSSCHSSTMTVSRSANISWLSSSDNKIESDSGVVIRASGQFCRRRRRSAAEVSPVLVPTCQHFPNVSVRSASGSSSAWAVSVANARSGVIQTIRMPGFSCSVGMV